MRKDDMKLRTKTFAINTMKAVRQVPRTAETSVITRQLLRCATSVGANYRSACLARSRADFVSKLGIVAEEADESSYWMELLVESGICGQGKLADLMQESRELTAIVLASIKTVRENKS